MCVAFVCCLCGILYDENKEDVDRLYVPTMIQKIDDTYFIIDCWQHRVLYSDKMHNELNKWKILTDVGILEDIP